MNDVPNASRLFAYERPRLLLHWFLNKRAIASGIKARGMAVGDKLVLQIALGNLSVANIALGALTRWRRHSERARSGTTVSLNYADSVTAALSSFGTTVPLGFPQTVAPDMEPDRRELCIVLDFVFRLGRQDGIVAGGAQAGASDAHSHRVRFMAWQRAVCHLAADDAG